MMPRQAVALATEIAKQYPFSVHGLDFRITNNPSHPGGVYLVIAEADFNCFSESQRLILTEEILRLLKLMTQCGVPALIEKIGEFND